MSNLRQKESLQKGDLKVFNYQDSDAYRLGKKHGEVFITDWTIDNNISNIIEDISKHVKSTWSIACLKTYDYKVTVRFIDKEDADWFEDSEWNNKFERKLLL